MKNRMILLIVVALALPMCLAGCDMGDAKGDAPTATPTAAPDVTNAPTADAVSYDWTANAAKIEGQIDQISEISECRVVVTGTTALVGVKFDPSYQGEMTERIREMVAAEVMAADPSIETVAVTAYAEDVEKVYALSDRMLTGKELDALREDINEIVRNATTLR